MNFDFLNIFNRVFLHKTLLPAISSLRAKNSCARIEPIYQYFDPMSNFEYAQFNKIFGKFSIRDIMK